MAHKSSSILEEGIRMRLKRSVMEGRKKGRRRL
jgi:hypothetical protein